MLQNEVFKMLESLTENYFEFILMWVTLIWMEEVNNYLNQQKINFKNCPLMFWKDKEKSFPRLSKIAKKNYYAFRGHQYLPNQVFRLGDMSFGLTELVLKLSLSEQ